MIKTLYPCFQHWSNHGSVYIISDTHFDDSDRQFMGYNISEQEQLYILKEACYKNDTLIHLGDVGNPQYLDKLKCYKVLIMGNHDTGKTKKYFNEVYTGPLIISDKIILSHEPVCLDIGIYKKPIAFNIHGHDHSGEYYNDNFHLNLAQNVWGYFPFNLKKFINDGILKHIDSIHRVTIDKQIEKKKEMTDFEKKYGFPF